MGEIGIIYEKRTGGSVSDVHHLYAGNASLTQKKNTSISGVFLFDVADGDHCLFRSPYASHEVSLDFFPGIEVINVRKDETPEEICELSRIIFSNRSM